ncbi:hypothetical protein FB45DRAFT_932862 [Roridomyces roridus]|uniref:Uncharacterized protein n=1 Tax=Roridomyces roridus TaxID=1738132 RepID=A0AAD7BD73_9AGAR|nr:hypothetical protein FB45DRAFT_932862 [Roridomyces roridus]
MPPSAYSRWYAAQPSIRFIRWVPLRLLSFAHGSLRTLHYEVITTSTLNRTQMDDSEERMPKPALRHASTERKPPRWHEGTPDLTSMDAMKSARISSSKHRSRRKKPARINRLAMQDNTLVFAAAAAALCAGGYLVHSAVLVFSPDALPWISAYISAACIVLAILLSARGRF